MKLLFDQNLSPRLVQRLSELYPGSAHVYGLGLDRASDTVLWNFARENGFILVTQDADFSELGEVLGFPPKVIWIRRGNCSTHEIEVTIRLHFDAILNLNESSALGILTII